MHNKPITRKKDDLRKKSKNQKEEEEEEEEENATNRKQRQNREESLTDHDAGAGRRAYYNPTIMRSFHWSKKEEEKKQTMPTQAISKLSSWLILDSWAPQNILQLFSESHLNSNKSADEESDVSRLMPHIWVGGQWYVWWNLYLGVHNPTYTGGIHRNLYQ